jgi:hypothetical protein
MISELLILLGLQAHFCGSRTGHHQIPDQRLGQAGGDRGDVVLTQL